MKSSRFSPTYVRLIDLLFKTDTIKIPMHQISLEDGRFQRVNTGIQSSHLSQDFYISASELWGMCTPHEWYLIGRISSELKEYNALWSCDPMIKKSSSNKKAIKGLIHKSVLVKTETTDIYIVNPLYIRRGDFNTVIATTARMLADSPRVEQKHICDKKAVRNWEIDKSLYLPEHAENGD